MNVQSSITAMPEYIKKWPTMKEIVDLTGPFVRKYWNVIFIVSCVFALLLDPLFLYIPIVNEEMKCMRMDNNLKITALVLRSLTDLLYMFDIYFQVCGSCNSNILSIKNILPTILKAMSDYSYIIVDILAVLPLPQVAVLILLSKMRGGTSLGALMNFLVLIQYVPRVFRIYLSCKESARTSREETPTWIKGVLNLFLYILASHVLGAFWYFFAVQRITTCWQNACQRENSCESSNFECHDYHTLRNVTFLSDSCPINPANVKVFDFGMFLDVLQFGMLGSTNYIEKFTKCFSWGLQNLSSLGSNLPLSINTWENLFAAFVSIIGLLLFLYLMGNLQTYMQLDVTRLENQRWKVRIKKKMEQIDCEVEKWCLPSRIKSDVMAKVLVELKENRHVSVEDVLSIFPRIFPSDFQSYVQSCMPLSRLMKVSLLQGRDEGELREISECLKFQEYKAGEMIIQEDTPLTMMIFTVDGLVSIESRFASSTLERDQGFIYGEQLLCWPAWTTSPPLSHESVRAINGVEVLVLGACDIESIGRKFEWESDKNIVRDVKWELLDYQHVAMLRKVPKLETMDTHVLKAISSQLKPMSYDTETWLIIKGGPLRMMIFVTGGSISFSDRHGYAEKKDGEDGWLRHNAGYFFGEELLDWVPDQSFPTLLPPSTSSIWTEKVDVLVLMAEDLATIASKYRSNFEMILSNFGMITDLSTFLKLPLLKKVPALHDIDDAVLTEISKYLIPKKYKKNDIIIREKKTLKMMIFILHGLVSIESRHASNRLQRGIGQLYGEQLLCRYFGGAPESARAISDVEVLVLRQKDISTVVHKLIPELDKAITFIDSEWDLLDHKQMAILRKVPLLQDLDAAVLEKLSSCMKCVRYEKDEIIIKMDKPLRKMIFILDGHVDIARRNFKSDRFQLGAGCFYGEQLLHWPAWTSIVSHETLKAVDEVLVFVLRAIDIKYVGKQYRWNDVPVLPDTRLVSMLKKVPKLEAMDTEVLKAISLHLKPMSYKAPQELIGQHKPLNMMIFFTSVHIFVGSWPKDCDWYSIRNGHQGFFVGEELLDWVLDTSFPTLLPLSTYSVESILGVDFFGLMAEDLASVASKYWLNFSRVITPPSTDLSTSLVLSSIKKDPVFKHMDEEVLKQVCSHMKLISYNNDATIIEKHKPLEMMFVFVQGALEISDWSDGFINVEIGTVCGIELVHWMTSWASHTSYPAKLPLSRTSVRVPSTGADAKVFVLCADDLKRIVSEFRSGFMKQTTLPIDSEEKLATPDPISMLKKVPILENMDEKVLKAICSHLKPMKYSDDSPNGCYVLKSMEKIDKMFFIRSGLVFSTDYGKPDNYYHSGNYFGELVLNYLLKPSSFSEVPTTGCMRAYECVGEVEVLALIWEDLDQVVSEFELTKILT